MDTTGGTPTLHAPVSLASFSFPTSPIASFPISPLDSEVPGDAAPQGHGWMSTGVAPSYYSAYDSVLGYESRSATNVRLYEGSSASKPGFDTPANSPLNHREEVRRQRNKSEQQRRDGLRGGFARLKDILPVSNQRGSKMSLVDRAVVHIQYLEKLTDQMQARLTTSELEVIRLRHLSETLMLEATEHFSSQSPL